MTLRTSSPLPPRTFTCDVCHETFACARSEADAIAECKESFGVTPTDTPCSVICDECYARTMALLQRSQQFN